MFDGWSVSLNSQNLVPLTRRQITQIEESRTLIGYGLQVFRKQWVPRPVLRAHDRKYTTNTGSTEMGEKGGEKERKRETKKQRAEWEE